MRLSGLMVKTPVRKTGDLRFKSQLRHKFFSQYLSPMLLLPDMKVVIKLCSDRPLLDNAEGVARDGLFCE